MATLLQAAASQKAPSITATSTGVTAGHGAKVLNGAHTHGASSVTGAAASHASYLKASESIDSTVVHNGSASFSSSIDVKEKIHERISIDISEQQKTILHEGACSFGDVLSQVPWMKFRLVAEPNMDIFASDIRLRTFIRQVTELTVSIVTKQCTEEIAVLVAALVASLTSSMEVRIKVIVETIISQIATLCLEDTMTACQNLHEIKEKICFPRHCEPNVKGCCDDRDSLKHHPHVTHGDLHPSHDGHGDKYPHHTQGEHKKHDSHSDHSDRNKRSNESEKHKSGDHKLETPKKPTGKSTPVPGAK